MTQPRNPRAHHQSALMTDARKRLTGPLLSIQAKPPQAGNLRIERLRVLSPGAQTLDFELHRPESQLCRAGALQLADDVWAGREGVVFPVAHWEDGERAVGVGYGVCALLRRNDFCRVSCVEL